jgi:hypothetical protein
MGPSQAIGGSETDANHDIKKPLELATFAPAPGREIHRDMRWGLVFFLQPAWTNMAARGRIPQQTHNRRSTVRKQCLPLCGIRIDSMWSRFCPEDASGQADTILITFFSKSALFTLQEIEESESFTPTTRGHMSQQESSSTWKSMAWERHRIHPIPQI